MASGLTARFSPGSLKPAKSLYAMTSTQASSLPLKTCFEKDSTINHTEMCADPCLIRRLINVASLSDLKGKDQLFWI